MAINLDEARDEQQGEPEMVDLFTLNGKTYQIPKKPKVNVALKFLRNARTSGEALAADVLLEDLLGKEGYEALTGYDDLTQAQLEQVMFIAQKTVLGSLEQQNQGKGPGARA